MPLAQRFEGLPPLPLPQPHWARGHYFSCPGKPAFTRLIYPMPNEAGLGVHVTLDLGGQMRFGPDVQWIPMAALGDEDYRVDPARAAPFAEAIRALLAGAARRGAAAGLRRHPAQDQRPGRAGSRLRDPGAGRRTAWPGWSTCSASNRRG